MEDVPNWDSQSAPSENRVPVSASIGGEPHIREDVPILFPRSVKTERQKGRNTERQNDRIQKYKKTDIVLSKARTSACFKLSLERPVGQLVSTKSSQ